MPSNNTISQVEVNGTTYDLLDANTLSAVSALNTRVSQLEDSVAYETLTSIPNVTGYKFGRVVVLEVSKNPAIEGTLFGTLPEGWRPPNLVSVPAVSGTAPCKLNVYTNGNIYPYGNQGTSVTSYSYYIGIACYVVAWFGGTK